MARQHDDHDPPPHAHHAPRRDSTDDLTIPAPRTRGGYMLMVAVISALISGGGTTAVWKYADQQTQRRLDSIEATQQVQANALSDQRVLTAGVVKDVEWLVRNRGGIPAPKN